MQVPIKQITIALSATLIMSLTMTSTTYVAGSNILPPVFRREFLGVEDPALTSPIPSLIEDQVTSLIPIVKEEEEDLGPRASIEKSPYRDLLERNLDYRGWITIPGTKINYPIVKSNDNLYYLKRSFDGNYDLKGSIFMDYRNLGFGLSTHIILYGHNMKDGSMFADLKNYKEASYAHDNPLIQIEDLYGTRYFKVYASYYARADSNLIKTSFNDEDDYKNFIQDQLDRSTIDYQLLPSTKSNTLTLVTCSYEVDDGRYFLHTVEVEGP